MPDPATASALFAAARRPHLVGVAGAAMRSLASLLLELGGRAAGLEPLVELGGRAAGELGFGGRSVVPLELLASAELLAPGRVVPLLVTSGSGFVRRPVAPGSP